jgi:predicted acyl esterase
MNDMKEDAAVEKKKPLYEVRVDKDVPIPVRDGTILHSLIYYPVSDEKFPVLLVRTPYGKDFAGADG